MTQESIILKHQGKEADETDAGLDLDDDDLADNPGLEELGGKDDKWDDDEQWKEEETEDSNN